MPRNRSTSRNLIEYAAARTVASAIQCFDVESNLDFAARIGSIYMNANDARRVRALANLRRSFPGHDPAWYEQTIEKSFQHMFQLFMVDSIFMPRLITPTTWPQHVTFHESIQPVVTGMIRNEPAIFLTAHCGSWEVLGFVLAVLGYPMAAIARPLDNPYLNDWLLGMREARGMQIITKWGGSTVVQDVLARGGRIAFTADQNAGDQGTFVPFFGRLASSYKSIALLAMRYRVPVISGFAQRMNGRFRFDMRIADVIYPEEWADADDPVFYITARYNRSIEMMIRSAPDQFLWLHRRWKSRPKHERQGQPFPEKLREKILQLPWMDEAQVERIVEDSRQCAADFRPRRR